MSNEDIQQILTDVERLRDILRRTTHLEASHRRVMKALHSEPPTGVSKIDWIAKQLNGV
ncbi:MAG: hypothetical protein WC477_03885 [Patescibacteria group bacterium]